MLWLEQNTIRKEQINKLLYIESQSKNSILERTKSTRSKQFTTIKFMQKRLQVNDQDYTSILEGLCRQKKHFGANINYHVTS